MYTLKIKKLHDDAIIPNFAHKGDAGMDLYSIEEVVIPASESRLIKTGISIALPKNTEAQVRPRSGLALKHSVTVLNTPGTIDEGYRGEIGVILINHGKEDFTVNKNMKIAQMVVKPIYDINILEVNDLDDTERGNGGFGSTGY
ncbi:MULTISPECIES: dUTP diphosphatase [Romboutsia]|uniref:Deoxyuridine 5'-triphosphate nucleotidohydrolase n=1 Tax=Romboutsia hominis TaxID=1507512 RepID=A0A2P2BP90_9FIRM|nr:MULTISPECIES: dUTP diphosphatase [Romboutsia]MDB8792294.1 dUTP diphosphatase [Romboutsia sp. 1001216sp1]MDB8795589.1 dUTP diphosphatase [Romboutsia sp. 1001216sp1]MDB8798532.1 dUTP diphosphatase [Romboutsia sp. 1001216sp1]MDB8803966.1 dUTP diphosphatase [Romboutsia sp. 1001216sp1]MDB8806684.1 dUTP diphosphatase [Romboutsia sp. 1001216sp1]